MNRNEFGEKLHHFTDETLRLAQERITEDLPPAVVYHASEGNQELGLMKAEQFLDLIYRDDGEVREWVNLSVETAAKGVTVFRCAVAPNFIRYDDIVRLRPREETPFVIGVPPAPPGWMLRDVKGIPQPAESLKVKGKYSLFPDLTK